MAAEVEYREGFTERISGKLLRLMAAYFFAVGLFAIIWLAIEGTITLDPVKAIGGVLVGGPAMLPYLFIRWRDDDSTTVPFASYLSG